MELFFRKTGNGPPVLIMHGLFGSSDNWMSIAKDLSAEFEVFAIDLRNHGQSPWSDDWDYKLMAGDIWKLMKKEKISKPHVIGHSMGGKVAMRMLVDKQAEVEKVIIADIGPKKYPVHHRDIIDALKSIDLQKLETREDADKALAKKISSFGVRQFLLKNLQRKGESFAWKANLEVIDKKIENVGEAQGNGKTIDHEVLFVRGEKSDYISDDDQVDIRSTFDKAKFITIKDAGHWIHAEQPSIFTEIVKNYFRD